MFRSITALTLLALAAAAPEANAQLEWNRRISDIRIVHPPATPPGTWRVVASVDILVTDTAPVPADYSFSLRLLLNGIEIGLTPVPVFGPNGPSCAPGGGNPCSNLTCNGINNGFINIAGQCGVYLTGVGPNPVCGCRTAMGDFDFGTSFIAPLHPTDTFTVEMVFGPGSLPERDVSDDTFSLTVNTNVIGTPFCGGDGTLPTPCPCGNTGTSGHGCGNSQNASGAVLTATGWSQEDPVTGTDTVLLHGSGMPATSSAIYLKSDTDNGTGVTFGDGVSCLTGAIIRLRTKINVGGASQFPEPGDPSLSVRGATPPGSGLTGWYQVFYRNAASAYCPPATYNISGGLRIDW